WRVGVIGHRVVVGRSGLCEERGLNTLVELFADEDIPHPLVSALGDGREHELPALADARQVSLEVKVRRQANHDLEESLCPHEGGGRYEDRVRQDRDILVQRAVAVLDLVLDVLPEM